MSEENTTLARQFRFFLPRSFLSKEELSFTPFPLMKRLSSFVFLLFLHSRKRFSLVSSTPDTCSSSFRPHAHVRRGCLLRATRLRHGHDGSVACRNARLKERLARTGSLPLLRRRLPKGDGELHQRHSRRLTMDRVLTARLSI